MSTSPHILSRLGRVAAVAAVGLLAATATAQADSVAYVKGGNIWLSTPDASRHHQVTFDGGYSTVSQSDLGRLAALKGDRIVTLERDGTVLHSILTPVSSGQPGTAFRGPFDPAISPDGRKISYTYYFQYTGYDPYCNPSNGCYVKQLYQGTGFTRPDRLTGWDELGYQRQSGWVGASWSADNEVLISDPSQPLNEDVVVYTPGDEFSGVPGGLSRWFAHAGQGGLRDGEQTRDRKKLAFVAGGDDKAINFYRAKGGYPTLPEACYGLSQPVGSYSSPSWSPDGSRLVWAEGDGVHTIAIPDMTNGCGDATVLVERLLIPGATSPDWGPADVPPARPLPPPAVDPPGGGGAAPPPPPAPAPGGDRAPGTGTPLTGATAGGGDSTAPPTTRRTTLSVKAPRLRTALRRGLSVTVRRGTPGRKLTLTAKQGKRTVGKGTAKVSSKGTARVRVRFTKAARASLARRSRVKLTLSGAGVAKKTLTLKR